MSAPVSQPLHVELSDSQLDDLAERVAAKLRGAELVDQDTLPPTVTRRVYLNASRSGALRTRKVGRRVVCFRRDLEEWIRSHPSAESKKKAAEPTAPEDEELLRIAKKNGAGVR